MVNYSEAEHKILLFMQNYPQTQQLTNGHLTICCSYTHLKNATGIARNTAIQAIMRLQLKGVLLKHKSETKGQHGINAYTLMMPID
jgi:hypothetical protein